MKKLLFPALFLSGFLLGLGSIFLFKLSSDSVVSQVRQGGYTLINPLLECNLTDVAEKGELKELEEGLVNLIGDLKDEGLVSDVSLYFRDLNNGPTFGINEKDKFAPASLLKIPVMMAYYHLAESGKVSLASTSAIPSDDDYNSWETFTSKNYLQKGKEYSLNTLIRAMIVSSDNNAMAVLMSNLGNEDADKVYKDLGVRVPGNKDTNDFMSVKEYASFFRILYNASYLTKDDSEKALKLLTETEFNSGLAGGLPKEVKVAHKFGERVSGEIRQLHDCGIIYLTDRPYLLCVMTKGKDFAKLQETLQRISSYTYQELRKH